MNETLRTLEDAPVGQEHDIVPAHLAVKAMRDSGYKNAAYALAELMDNAIQAGASEVELLCGERPQLVSQRERDRIDEIAVLDNGSGMDAEVLRLALQFGNGTYLDPEDQTGIGKFGMGLPNSSISQCRRVDVWSWQSGPASALHTHIDIDDVTEGRQGEVPPPERRPIPDVWRQAGNAFDESGTLVVWSRLDRVRWRTARAIIRNSERLIGRMYRKFLNDGQTRIRLCAFDLENPADAPKQDDRARPNDPTYLMSDTSCPDPPGGEPMFEPWGKRQKRFEIADENGATHEVRVTVSQVRSEAREGYNPGGEPHGKHAKKNQGVSVVRAGRELEIEESWNYEPTARWWGVEVAFPPALDDVFGVSNNKQAARNFRRIDVAELKEDGETREELVDRLNDERDPNGPLIAVSDYITKSISTVRRLLKNRAKGKRTERKRHEKDQEAEQQATEQTKRRQNEGYRGDSDEDEDRPEEERKQDIADELESSGFTEDDAADTANNVVQGGMKYEFIEAGFNTMAFFSVKPKGGTILVKLNTMHPAYTNLVEVLEEPTDDADEDELRERLHRARDGLRLLLMAWARYEDEAQGEKRYQAQDARFEWGSIAQGFLQGGNA
jgi:hypothetical protein